MIKKQLRLTFLAPAIVALLSGCNTGPDLVDESAAKSAPEVIEERTTGTTLFDEGMVAPDGLWLTRARFGKTLTPKGPCIQVYKGYIFVTRY